jgi:hypothetical protein
MRHQSCINQKRAGLQCHVIEDSRERQVKHLAGARHAHVAKAALFFFIAGAFRREEPFRQTNQKDDGKLFALRLVQGQDMNDLVGILSAFRRR